MLPLHTGMTSDDVRHVVDALCRHVGEFGARMTVAAPVSAGPRPPDFVIAGAPRCGTTWLYYALDRHPSIWLAKPVKPEPKFFLVDECYRQGLDYYIRRWFSAVPDGVIAGEKSTNYLESRPAAERLARDLPAAKLIFLLREPTARALSNYRWTCMNGLEDLEFAEALEQEARREKSYEGSLSYSRPFSYFTRGLYELQLRPWFELFPRERILIERTEDLADQPSSVLNEVYRFLGVAPSPVGEEVGIVNATEPGQVDPTVLARLRERYREPNEDLYRVLGSRLWSDE